MIAMEIYLIGYVMAFITIALIYKMNDEKLLPNSLEIAILSVSSWFGLVLILTITGATMMLVLNDVFKTFVEKKLKKY